MSHRFDLHVHSRHSRDARGSVMDLAMAAQEAGLHGFCLTDHDTIAGHKEIEQAMHATGLLIVPGIEVTAAEGHVLAIGATRAVPKGLGLDETIGFIEQQGAVPVPAHPLRMLSGIGPTSLQDHAAEGGLRVAEGLNARDRRMVQENTLRRVQGLGLAATGGSDAHWVRDIGTAYTVLDRRPASAEDLVAALHDGLCRAEGGSLRRRSVWGHSISLAVPPLRRRFVKP